MDQKYETIIEDYLDPLAEYEQLFRTVFERSQDAVFVSEPDPEGAVIEANPAAAEMHGYSIEDFAKLKTSQLHPIESVHRAKAGLDRMLEGGWVEVEHEHIRKDGSRFPVLYRAGAVQYLGRKVILSFVRDLTSEKRVEDALLQCEMTLASWI